MDKHYKKMNREELIEYIEKIVNQRAISYEDRMKLAFLDEAPFTIWACDSNRKIKLWEGKCEKVYDKTKEQVIGKDFVEEFVDQYEREDAIEDCETIISTGQHMHNLAEDKDCFGHSIKTLYTHCFRVFDVETKEPLQAEMAVKINVEDELKRFQRIRERGKILDNAHKELDDFISLFDNLQDKIYKKSKIFNLENGFDKEVLSLKASLAEDNEKVRHILSQLIIDTKNCESAANCKLLYKKTEKKIKQLRDRMDKFENRIDEIFNKNVTCKPKRFKVALSFPGEYRESIRIIANNLATKFSKEEILYDSFHTAEFARPNLDTYLQNLYHNNSDLIVVCLCKKYNEKDWCGLEWRSIRDLMNRRKDNSIMFLRTDDGHIDGVFGTVDGYISLTESNIDEVTKHILKRHEML